jgi:hypothetical protein
LWESALSVLFESCPFPAELPSSLERVILYCSTGASFLGISRDLDCFFGGLPLLPPDFWREHHGTGTCITEGHSGNACVVMTSDSRGGWLSLYVARAARTTIYSAAVMYMSAVLVRPFHISGISVPKLVATPHPMDHRAGRPD